MQSIYIYYLYSIVVSMGGKAAEEVVLGKNHVTSGVSSDLEHV